MNKTLIQMQIIYEITSKIGGSLDLVPMLRESLSAYLQKLNCFAGMAFQAVTNASGLTTFLPVVMIPSKARPSAALEASLRHIPSSMEPDALEAYYAKLPLLDCVEGDKHCYVMDLPNFGLLLLIKAGQPFDDAIVRSLARLNSKLAESCRVCLQNEEIAKINRELRREVQERQRAEGALREVLEALESRVAERTHDLVKTNRQLEEALANVKILGGLLPICSACKKIRDDQGYWRQIESYIARHTEAVFTHGICPDCTKKLYPEVEIPPEG